MQTESQLKWPIVARDDEFRRALAALDGTTECHGVALLGDSGVGKSTLARALARAIESSGRTVRFVLGTQTGCAVPLGAFSRSVTVNAAHGPAAMLAAAHKTLEQEGDLVVVDDAQLLDPLSATLVHQLAANGSVRLVVAIRSGEPVPDAVASLWKERLLLTLHIDPFTGEQTGELARRVLGGVVAPRLVDELHRRSGGNLLLLRGLLSAGRENGVLVHTEDGWQLRGPLHPDRELYDLLEFRLRSLAPEELEAVELLAAGELLDWEVLRGLCDADAAARLEQRGLIQLVADGSALVAQLNHPVIGEAALRLAGVVRTRQLNGLLAQALRRHALEARRSRLPDVRGQIRLAQFMMRSDLPPDLDVIIDAAATAMAMSDIGEGEELSRFAFDRGGGLPAAILLADAMSWQGRGDEVEAVLGECDLEDANELLAARWGCQRALNLFFGCGQTTQAQQVLAGVKDRVDSESMVGLITAVEVTIACFSSDLPNAIEAGLTLCASDVPPLATVWAAASTCWALALSGQFGELHHTADRGLRAASLAQPGVVPFVIGLAEVTALTAVGDLSAAERVWQRYAAMAAGAHEADAFVHAMLGLVELGRGALPAAGIAFHDSISAMSRGFPSGWLMLVAAWAAQVEGRRGNAEAAVAALRRSEEAYGPQAALFLPELELARAWERAAAGQTSTARMHAARAAQIARRSGMHAVEMRALHTTVRFGDRAQAGRLQGLAKTLNTRMSETVAAHAHGLVVHDGVLLDAAADRFAEMGALGLAADAAAQAARAHARTGNRGKELAASTRAYWLASKCEIRTPAVNAAARPLPITDREREVAMLVAGGLSNRQIADRLCLSVRTVDGHLYRTFAKLGIERRDELVHLVNGARSATSSSG